MPQFAGPGFLPPAGSVEVVGRPDLIWNGATWNAPPPAGSQVIGKGPIAGWQFDWNAKQWVIPDVNNTAMVPAGSTAMMPYGNPAGGPMQISAADAIKFFIHGWDAFTDLPALPATKDASGNYLPSEQIAANLTVYEGAINQRKHRFDQLKIGADMFLKLFSGGGGISLR